MSPKHKNKGKGVGKGQSNRHKINKPQEIEYASKEEKKTASKLVLHSTDERSIDSEPKTDPASRPKNTNIEATSEQGVCKNNMHSRYRSRPLSKEDPLMADLVWRSVSPDDERIPRLPFFSFHSTIYFFIYVAIRFKHYIISIWI